MVGFRSGHYHNECKKHSRERAGGEEYTYQVNETANKAEKKSDCKHASSKNHEDNAAGLSDAVGMHSERSIAAS